MEQEVQQLPDGTLMIPSTDEAWDDRILGADERYVAVADDATVLAVTAAAMSHRGRKLRPQNQDN